MKKAVLFLVCVLLVSMFSCTKKQAPLTILTEDYPPLSFAAGDSISGFAADVVASIQQVLKTNYKPTLLKWDAAYNRVITEPNVVLFSMERTPEREDLVHWIGPLGETKTFLYARKDNPIMIQSLEEAKALKAIATTTNWFSEQYLKNEGFENLVSSEKPSDSIKQIISGRVEISVFSALTFNKIAEDAGYVPSDFRPIFELMSSSYYIAISKGTDPQIVANWKTAFEQIKANGTLDKLKAKWL